MADRRLQIPLTTEDILSLQLGDIVYFNGLIFTARSQFHVRAIDQGILPPIDFKRMNVLMHTGPVMKQTDEGWLPISIGPTSSLRFERYSPALIRKLKLRAIIGKTTMGEESMKAMKEVGCIHLTRLGAGAGGTDSANRAKVKDVYFKDEVGSIEATWILDVNDFGPFIVDIDVQGNNLFHNLDKVTQQNMEKAFRRLGVSPEFKYTRLA